MSVKGQILIPKDVEFEIENISLLTCDEAIELRNNFKLLSYDWWWLCSPGDHFGYAAVVRSYGDVDDVGDLVCIRRGVRPAITISNLKSFNLSLGDTCYIKGKRYIVISKNRVLYDDEPVLHRFDTNSNDYNKSEIKQIVDNWLNEGNE